MESKPAVDSTHSTKAIFDELANIQIIIEVIATRLVECRKLRLDDITLDEIAVLETKIIKHINQQLEAKEKIQCTENLIDLRKYPSFSNFLTLAGVSKSFRDSWEQLSYSIEDILSLSDLKLESILEEICGNTEDNQKFLITLADLKKYNGSNDNAIVCSRNSSESSGSFPSESVGRTQIEITSIEPDNLMRSHVKEIPSTSSSSMTPPSPNHGSHSSLDNESDSAFSISQSQGSPPPKITMNIFSPSSTLPLPSTPVKLSHSPKPSYFTSTSIGGRSRFPSADSKTTHSTTLAPKLKTSKSYEWNVGNRLPLSYGLDKSLCGSNQSLSSIASHSSPSLTKHTAKAKKKKNRRPPNVSLDTDSQLNFISLSRTAIPKSAAVSPDCLDSSSPLSPRTPGTPTASGTLDLAARGQELFSVVPSTPKTPKSNNFKAVKNFFKLGIKKLKRNKSTEQLQDLDDESPHIHRKRSGTLPSSKSSTLVIGKNFSASNPSSTCVTPLTSPDDILFDDASNVSSRPCSLVDTDRTIVAEPSEFADHNAQQEGNPDVQSVEDEPLTKGNLFSQENVMHSEEWDILYDDLDVHGIIGYGRVGTVYRGYWHGDVAIRVIDVNHNVEEKLEAFKQEIGVFKKTRHENLELFMGSCMHPPHLAIVTGFCHGDSLYNYIRDGKLPSSTVNQVKKVAQHIVQGMGYLHSKGIVHKDLKSKNIFVDGKRVVITGFGLVGLHAVACDPTRSTFGLLMIPRGWLCYLAPELILSLTPPRWKCDDVVSTLPYTNTTDVYAFGTVWYELLSGSLPFESCPAESIIWQAGSGKKHNPGQIQGGKDVKDLLTQCWSFDPTKRPDFTGNGIMGSLDKLQNQMQRSRSSHPRKPGPIRAPSHDLLFDRPHLRHVPISKLHDLAE